MARNDYSEGPEMPFTDSDWISVEEAAARLGRTPWEVKRLAESHALDSAVLIKADSLAAYQQEQQ
jgi:hypothetical protein